ncbi:hypothetical protein DL767_003975 [Monosporascus sp. MG133]|nr:hypothetical protein DL767_003975 [Monosporascus sp. MG133]
MKTDHYLNLCLEQAELSPLGHRHGCIVVKGGKVIGKGFNDYRPGFDGGALKTGILSSKSFALDKQEFKSKTKKDFKHFEAVFTGTRPGRPVLSMHSEMMAINSALSSSSTLAATSLSRFKPSPAPSRDSKRQQHASQHQNLHYHHPHQNKKGKQKHHGHQQQQDNTRHKYSNASYNPAKSKTSRSNVSKLSQVNGRSTYAPKGSSESETADDVVQHRRENRHGGITSTVKAQKQAPPPIQSSSVARSEILAPATLAGAGSCDGKGGDSDGPGSVFITKHEILMLRRLARVHDP